MLKKIVLGLALILAVFVAVVALQPAEFRVTRSATLAAPLERVFPHVNELKMWESWNPWFKLDPAMTMTYSGPAGGTGASYAWAGNDQVGEGKLTITESKTNELVRIRLEFFKPMSGVSPTVFTFQPEGTNTTVSWTMHGTNGFVAKAFCLFMDMDTMIGTSFEQGLASLKTAVEAPKP
jgi:hypothetical protein